MPVSTQKASVHHVDSVCQLDFRVFGSSTRSKFLEESIHHGKLWVAQSEDRVVGFAVMAETFFGHSFIELLIVDPDYRRQGFGSLLMRKMESISLTEKLFTSTNMSNTAMQRLCESLGFIKSGYVENLDEGDPEIMYFKRPSTIQA